MGLFNDKLLLRLTATATPGGKQELQIEKIENKIPHLLPFSCISLVGAQFTQLASHHVRSLALTLLDFIQKPEAAYKDTNVINGFDFEIYRNYESLLYNHFNPRVGVDPPPDANRSQADIVHLINNYVLTVYDDSSEADKTSLLYFLLTTISFYQRDVFPVLSKINDMSEKKKVKQRKKLTRTELTILSTLHQRWNYRGASMPGSAAFQEKVNEAKKFNSYLL
jgi:hypothetical protein